MQSVMIYRVQDKYSIPFGVNLTMPYYYFDKLYIFDEYKPLMQSGDTAVITWTAIIRAYNIHEQGQEALQLFHEMQESGVVPNEYTYSSILSTIADLTNLQEGQQIHTQLMVILLI
jgi:pentatricopeptide repeat protein